MFLKRIRRDQRDKKGLRRREPSLIRPYPFNPFLSVITEPSHHRRVSMIIYRPICGMRWCPKAAAANKCVSTPPKLPVKTMA
jgi:hypothetical protein